ncbi:hypothetical protein GF362_06270 [Candidatus Dojkabacteria bacterium]|nr:hypothetical protein [Candidatus Dojkabacteria bacterium]
MGKIFKKQPHIVEKIFRIIPGMVIWLLLTSPIWLSPTLPAFLANFIIVFAVYWLYRTIIFVIGLVIGYNKFQKAKHQDWLKKCNKLNFNKLPNQKTLPQTSKLPKHLIVIPIGSAKYNLLKQTLDAIKNQNYPKEYIYISLSFEQRLVEHDFKYYKKLMERIQREYSEFEDNLMIFTHPKNIKNEAIGAAANRSWGTKKAVDALEKRNMRIEDFIITSPDEDLKFHPEYLATVSYQYLTTEDREKKFYQTAVYLFHNNYWKVPLIIRVWSMSLSLPVLSSSVTHRTDRETWSCYSINLKVMKEVNYWNTAISIDDTPFYWRPFDYFDGDFECITFFVPVFADAVYHPNKIKNYKAQYKQLVRWGWGIITFPIAMRVLLTNKKIPLLTKLKKLSVMFEIMILTRLAAILLTIAIPLITIMNPDFSYTAIAYSLPETLSSIMSMLTFFMIPTIFYKFLLLPKVPKKYNKLRFILEFIMEIPMHILVFYTFAFLPFLVGPTKMMLGYSYQFVITEKKE